MLINEWKNSSDVENTRNGNPRPPPVETVCDWVRRPWREAPITVVINSIEVAGFHEEPSRWFIWNHGVYGQKFQQKWRASVDDDDEKSEDPFNLDEIDVALDDVEIVEE